MYVQIRTKHVILPISLHYKPCIAPKKKECRLTNIPANKKNKQYIIYVYWKKNQANMINTASFTLQFWCCVICYVKKNKLKFDFFDMVNILLYMLFEPYQHAGKCP